MKTYTHYLLSSFVRIMKLNSRTALALASVVSKRSALSRCGLALFVLGWGTLSSAAQTTFTVVNNGFTAYRINGVDNPTLTLRRGVTYTFNVNAAGHPFYIKTVSGIGTGNAYNNGVVNNGVTVGTLTFAVPTSAPSTLFYNCSLHLAMKGTLNIVDPPSPPIVVLTNPPSGITLAAPATIVLRASASDLDGSVTNVQFLSGTALLGNDNTSPYSLTASNLVAGAYHFAAKATDNSGLSATSAVVTVSVVTPGTIRFDTNLAPVNGQLPLRLTVTPGLSYEIDYTSTLTNWLFFTNFLATNAVVNFSAPIAESNHRFFRAWLLPNP